MESCCRVFNAETGDVEEVISFISSLSSCLSERKRQYLDLAVEEIFVNICLYAYEMPPGTVRVAFEELDDSVSVEFQDDGLPFDPLAQAEPDLTLAMEDRSGGGLGILLTRRVMDEVHYNRKDGKNSLKIVVRK